MVHMGKVRMDGVTEFLREIYDDGRIRSDEAKAFIEEHKEHRRRLGEVPLQASLKSLAALAKEAEKRGILIGIENRYHIHDFPDAEEFAVIFREFAGSPVRYWHDIGHATAQENLGLIRKGELLERFGGFLAGVHLHGCTGYHDHYAPGSGEEDYELLKKYLQPETIRVVETHHRSSRADLIKGIEFLKEQGIA